MHPHISVLLNQCLEAFEGQKLEVFVDGTLGAGGHAAALLQAHSEIKTFIGIDQDPEALEIAQNRLKPWESKVQLKRGNFSEMDQLVKEPVDGILLDIGVSSMQLDRPEKGFSFMHPGPLDMRMNPDNPLTAEVIINTWTEEEIGRIFREYGEEKKWKLAARAIVRKRPFYSTKDLVEALYGVLKSKKDIHPLTLVFQALRIAVNGELEVLEKVLPKALNLLKPGGRLAIISFHSLEDRIVKNFFRYEADDKMSTSGIGGLFLDKHPTVKLLTKKPLAASKEEIAANPRSRSAKLRVLEKI